MTISNAHYAHQAQGASEQECGTSKYPHLWVWDGEDETQLMKHGEHSCIHCGAKPSSEEDPIPAPGEESK